MKPLCVNLTILRKRLPANPASDWSDVIVLIERLSIRQSMQDLLELYFINFLSDPS